MSVKAQPYTQSYFASCAVGLEEVLSKEIQALGGKKVTLERGGVEFKGVEIIALKAILHSRTASRIYKRLYSSSIVNEKDIHEFSKDIPWNSIFDIKQTFKIRTLTGYGLRNLFPDSFKNSVYLTQMVKDGIVDFFRIKFKDRPSVEMEKADVNILLRVVPNGGEAQFDNNNVYLKGPRSATASLYLDLCGTPLHQRGYRINQGEAPVKENIAAGIIQLMDWDHEKEVFIDSMCGSGTFLIEAALIKADIPPSFMKILKFARAPEYRYWDFLELKFFTDNQKLKDEFNAEIDICKNRMEDGHKRLDSEEPTIFGFDINTDVIRSCADNLSAAQVKKAIQVKQIDSSTLKWDSDKKGVIFCNPPYGERLGDMEKLHTLYRDYGDNLKENFKGFKAYVFTGNPDLKNSIILQPSRKFPLFNGPIECRLLKYDLY